MQRLFRTLGAFFVRDFLMEWSYRISFVLNFTSIIFSTLTFFFLARLIGNSPTLQQYNGDYFSFAVIGIALGGYFSVGLSSFASSLREAQTTGTLEAMLMTPTPLPLVIVGSALWNYAFTTFRVAIYLIIALLLGLNLSHANYLGALMILLLAIIAFASIGILAASLIVIIKRGDPVTAIFGGFANLVGGTLYPVETLPHWLQPIAKLLPLSYALNGLRDALLKGASWQQLAPNAWALLFFCVCLLPLSLLAFHQAVEWARRDGSLADY